MSPLSSGLLIERRTEGETGAGLPTLFSLLSPTSDLCPVVTRHFFTHGKASVPYLIIVKGLLLTQLFISSLG